MKSPTLVLVLALGFALSQLPFLGRPIHYDEANFWVLAQGVLADPWRPHEVLINWQGNTQRAFEVLSNPPGIAYVLALAMQIAPGSVSVARGFMLLWTLPMVVGAVWIAEALSPAQERSLRAAALIAMPMVVMSGTALLPDAPLYALTLLGVGGLLRGKNPELWAFILGLASMFRYSGLALVPLAFWLVGVRATPVLGPIALLAAHDISAYGEVHLLAMGKFQSVSNTLTDWLHKGVSATTFLGGALVLPLFRWREVHLSGALIGALGGWLMGGEHAVAAALFGAAGGAALASGVAALADANRRGLGVWAGLGFGFLLTLRFTAARYWLPFAPALVMSAPYGGAVMVVVPGTLGVALLWDDALTSAAVGDLAERAMREADPGVFTGHWGWQWALEQRGWRALDEGARAPVGVAVAMPSEAWPQRVDVPCAEVLFEGEADRGWPMLPRAYSAEARVNLHANWQVGRPPVRTVLPWGFATDPVETARVCR